MRHCQNISPRLPTLLIINVTLTALWELLGRWFLGSVIGISTIGALVTVHSSHFTLNQQALINILMTFWATLFSWVVLYLSRRELRYLFFILFAITNSIISQALAGYYLDSAVMPSPGRIFFDFAYSGSLKFFVFELGRPLIFQHAHSVLRIGAIRTWQDCSLAICRILLLGMLGLDHE